MTTFFFSNYKFQNHFTHYQVEISTQTLQQLIGQGWGQCNIHMRKVPVNRKFPENRKLSEKQLFQPNLIIKVWSK